MSRGPDAPQRKPNFALSHPPCHPPHRRCHHGHSRAHTRFRAGCRNPTRAHACTRTIAGTGAARWIDRTAVCNTASAGCSSDFPAASRTRRPARNHAHQSARQSTGQSTGQSNWARRQSAAGWSARPHAQRSAHRATQRPCTRPARIKRATRQPDNCTRCRRQRTRQLQRRPTIDSGSGPHRGRHPRQKFAALCAMGPSCLADPWRHFLVATPGANPRRRLCCAVRGCAVARASASGRTHQRANTPACPPSCRAPRPWGQARANRCRLRPAPRQHDAHQFSAALCD